MPGVGNFFYYQIYTVFKSIIKTNCYTACTGGNSCCTTTNKCGENEGDCDTDSQCKEGLKCGTDNCIGKSGFQWGAADDCCYKPGRNLLNLLKHNS